MSSAAKNLRLSYIESCDGCHGLQGRPDMRRKIELGIRIDATTESPCTLATGHLAAYKERASSTGCVICLLIYKAASLYQESWADVAKDEVLLCISSDRFPPPYVELTVRGYQVPNGQCWVEPKWQFYDDQSLFSVNLFQELGSPSPISFIPSFSHIPADPLSDESESRVRSWLESCRSHPNCKSPDYRVFPKRLVDVGDGTDTTIRLIQTPAPCRYLTFSHCWGVVGKPLCTTRENQTSMMSEIPPRLLTQSFRDAIRVTRWLGFRYIWIDSLCIIQDDPLDWEEEASRMAGIYGSCELAIAATRAAGGSEGFLQIRPKSPLVLSERLQDDQMLSVYVRGEICHGPRSRSVPWHCLKCPTFSRAWCFQERFLAPKMLHFTFDEIFFECRTADRCECGGSGVWLDHGHASYAYYAAALSASRKLHSTLSQDTGCRTKVASTDALIQDMDIVADNRADRQGAFLDRMFSVGDWHSRGFSGQHSGLPIKFGQLWSGIVSEYSERDLTFTHDVLPALSGVANLMLEHSPGRYLAGLWERDIHYLLGWRSLSNNRLGECFRPPAYTAPSFSWASRVGPVLFPIDCLITHVCEIVDFRIDLKGGDPFGQVKGGFISLRGKLMSAEMRKDDENDSFWLVVENCQGNEKGGKIDFDTVDDQDECCQNITEKVHCFELFREGDFDIMDDKAERSTTSLVLRLLQPSGTFRRVGRCVGIPSWTYDSAPDTVITIC